MALNEIRPGSEEHSELLGGNKHPDPNVGHYFVERQQGSKAGEGLWGAYDFTGTAESSSWFSELQFDKLPPSERRKFAQRGFDID